MNILITIKNDPDSTLNTVIESLKKTNEVDVVDVRKDKNYDEIVDKIEKSDRTISW